MFKNYLKIAWRHMRKNSVFSFINIFGLAIGMAAFWMIVLYAADELSYDKYNANANRIYRVVQHAAWDGGNMNVALTSPPFATALKATFPEIEDAARVDAEGGGVLTANIANEQKILKTDDIVFADNSLLKIFPIAFYMVNPQLH